MKIGPLALAAALLHLPACAFGQTNTPYKRTLDGPHKAHTRHSQLCIPQTTGIVECDGMADGDMMQWDEFSYTVSGMEYGTAVMSDRLYLKSLAARTTPEGSEDMWKPDGTVTENGVQYNKFVLRPTDVPLGNENNVLLQTGALPDRLEYLEAADGSPYAMRQYSGANQNLMYSETMFMMAEELSDDEMEQDPREMAMNMAVQMTGSQPDDHVEEDPIPVPRSLRATPFASQATMPKYYHRNENWVFWDEFSDGTYPKAALSSFQVAQKANDDGSTGDVVGITTFVDRPNKPIFERSVADAPDTIVTDRVDLQVDEWIIRVEGTWHNGLFKRLAFVTNRGEMHEFDSINAAGAAHAKQFTWEAQDGEALYGIRAYVEQTEDGDTYLRDIKALWGEAPSADQRRLSVVTTTKAAAAANRGLRGGRRNEGLEVEVEANPIQRFKIEFPTACVESSRNGKCLSVFQEETRSIDDFAVVESVSTNLYFRYRTNRRNGSTGTREAELEGVIETGQNGDIELLQITGRGCVTPGEFKVGSLASVSATKCLFGDIAWRSDRTITGQVGASFTLTKEVIGREFKVELEGRGGVRSQTSGRSVRFAGYTGSASLDIDVFSVVNVGVTGMFDHFPNNVVQQDDWVTDVRVRPEISVNLFLFRASAGYTFRVVQIGPESREETTDRFAPGTPPYPDVSHLQFDQYITDLARVSQRGTHIDEVNTSTQTAPQTPVSSIQVASVIQATRRARRASRYNNHRDEVFSIRTTNKARDGKPAFSRSIGQQAQAGFRRVDVRQYPRVDLDDDEWIVKVSGFWYQYGIWQLNMETNKGRVLDYVKDSSPPSSVTNFEFEAPTGYALYGFDGYVERESSTAGGFVRIRTDRIQDFQVAWGKAPDLGCNLPQADSDLCIPKLVSNEELRCTGFPRTTGFNNNEERCLLANEQLNDGYQYVYNHNRFTQDSDVEPECGVGANCWCCRRRVRVAEN